MYEVYASGEPKKGGGKMSFQKEPTERQNKTYLLRGKAQSDKAALELFRIVELECNMILKTPNSVPESMVKRYNQLVRSSDLPLPEREELLIKEKNK